MKMSRTQLIVAMSKIQRKQEIKKLTVVGALLSK